KEIFGIVSNDQINDIITKEAFNSIWKISKSNIEICKDCEYRFMCPDNRIPQKKVDNSYQFDEDCNYNPYTNEWD
ncbi:MAG: radical SAM protein, partial [Candidatus Paceibacterota bacterium]